MPDISINQNTHTVNVQEIQKNLQNNAIRRNIKIVNERNDSLGKDSFLKLLIKQLEQQDPLNPVSDREFISQMAQFSSLEKMTEVSKSVNSLRSFQANSLLGKSISGKDFVTGKLVSGIVNRVLFDNANQVFLNVNGRNVKFDDVVSIASAPQGSHEAGKSNVSKNAINTIR